MSEGPTWAGHEGWVGRPERSPAEAASGAAEDAAPSGPEPSPESPAPLRYPGPAQAAAPHYPPPAPPSSPVLPAWPLPDGGAQATGWSATATEGQRPYGLGSEHSYGGPAGYPTGYPQPGPPAQPPYFDQPPYGPPPNGEARQGPLNSPGGPPRQGRSLRSAAALLALVSAAAAGAAVSRVAWPSTQSSSASPSTTVPPTAGQGGTSTGPADVAEVAAKVDPAVVDVDVQFSYQNAEGAGTGIVLSPNGLVLTNNHVIDESTSVRVTDVGNGRTYGATVLGYDSTHDVALLKLQGASGLPVAQVARSKPSIGLPVVAIGNAGGTGGTPVAAPGTVIGLNQDITASDALTETSENLTGLIETSADVQSGDSGGPLVNSSGQVIGIDTAATGSFAFSQTGNQGYAIPITRAVAIAKDIEAGRGTSTVHVGPTAFIGLRLYSQTSNQNPFQFPGVGPSTTQPASSTGLEVYAVIPGTGAAKAGLAQGDVLTKFNGAELTSDAQLAHMLVRYHPGEKVDVGWVTPKGQDESATIKLTSGPPA